MAKTFPMPKPEHLQKQENNKSDLLLKYETKLQHETRLCKAYSEGRKTEPPGKFRYNMFNRFVYEQYQKMNLLTEIINDLKKIK
jgi:hypothetical protein